MVSGSIPAFTGGVSQQDEAIRNPSQARECINAWLSPALGNVKRPPTQFVYQLAYDIPATAFFHPMIRDEAEKYLLVIHDGRVRVFDHISGYEYQVSITDGTDMSYFTSDTSGRFTFKACTVADTTFIVNTRKVVEMDAELAPGDMPTSVQTFQDLPTGAAPLSMYVITGDPNNGFDQYYVQKSDANVFDEVSKPGITYKLNRSTMPYVLKRIPDENHLDGLYFSLGAPEWDERAAGDENTNPPPAFVGQKLNEVFFHLDRLGFLAGENILLSETGYYWNFWRTTVTDLLDSDPISVASNSREVAKLDHAIPYQRALLLFGSDGTQLQLTGEPTLTPKSAKLDVIANYRVSAAVRPELVGESVYYVTDHGDRSTVREYFVDDQQVTGDAADVTGHVPSYVPGGVRAMAASADFDTLFIASDQFSVSARIYVYQSRWQGNEKVQSAWHRWEIGSRYSRVVYLRMIGSRLYIVAQLATQSGCELLYVDLQPEQVCPWVTTEHDIYLDNRMTVTSNYVAFGNYTEIALPYTLYDLTGVTVFKSGTPGTMVNLYGAALSPDGRRIRIFGDQTGTYVVGLDYSHEVTLSRQYLRDSSGNAVLIGRLQLRSMTVEFRKASAFRVRVAPNGREATEEVVIPELLGKYNARTVGDNQFLLGIPSMRSGTVKFPVLSRSDLVDITLCNDTPFPASLQAAMWEALYTTRSRV